MIENPTKTENMLRLQSVLLPHPDICATEELYFHKENQQLLFDGYFNLFYIEKYNRYTSVNTLSINLALCGFSEIRLMHDRDLLAAYPLTSEVRQSYCFSFPYDAYKAGVFWFALEADNKIEASRRHISGGYVCEAKEMQTVNLAVDICTFRREPYVLRNLKNFCSRMAQDPSLNVWQHLHLWLIDNGQSLSKDIAIQELVQSAKLPIYICPNRNAGGAGGFTRGMLEILAKKEKLGLNRVLLMDDDAVFDADVFVRIYGFASVLKKEYRDIIIGGNLLREDCQYIQQVCGEWYDRYIIWNKHPYYDLRSFEACTAADMTGTKEEHRLYSGWWCCSYSLNVVREDNLPLPLFIHHDDIEFGIRNVEKGIVFLNGIGAWHRGSELTYTGVNLYYDVRNSLMTEVLHDPAHARKIDVLRHVYRNMTATLFSYRYEEAMFAYQGVLDFCKGPEWLVKQKPEELHAKLRAQYNMQPLENLKEKLTPEEYADAKRQIEEFQEDFEPQQLEELYRPHGRKRTVAKLLTLNGWLLPAKNRNDQSIKVLFPLEASFDAFREKKVLHFEPENGKGAVRVKRYGVGFHFALRYLHVLLVVLTRYDKAAKSYRERVGQITNAESWKRYLGI